VRYVEIIPFLLHNERNFWYWALTYVPIHFRNPQNQKPPNSRYDAYYPDFWVATRPAGNPAYRLSEPTVDPLELYGWNKYSRQLSWRRDLVARTTFFRSGGRQSPDQLE